MTNDPLYGGIHLPDMLIIVPIFYKKTLAFFAAARGHWTDVGGSTPGSLSGKASELIQEGIVIPPIKLFEGGRLNDRLADLLFSNMRMREIRFGDMMSQTAAFRHAEKSCLDLIDKYGMETTERCGKEIINRTERSLRRKLQALQGTGPSLFTSRKKRWKVSWLK
jgi:N-methylhydantoinase B